MYIFNIGLQLCMKSVLAASPPLQISLLQWQGSCSIDPLPGVSRTTRSPSSCPFQASLIISARSSPSLLSHSLVSPQVFPLFSLPFKPLSINPPPPASVFLFLGSPQYLPVHHHVTIYPSGCNAAYHASDHISKEYTTLLKVR